MGKNKKNNAKEIANLPAPETAPKVEKVDSSNPETTVAKPRVSNLVGREVVYKGKPGTVIGVYPAKTVKGNNARIRLDDGTEYETAETYARVLAKDLARKREAAANEAKKTA